MPSAPRRPGDPADSTAGVPASSTAGVPAGSDGAVAASRGAIAANLAGFQRVAIARPDLRAAAVAVCVLAREGECCLLITRRAANLRNHPGQWALPGGSRDPGESPEDAALRELHEETGLAAVPDDVLGLLDDFATRSGYLITPVIVWGGPATTMDGPPSEVARIHVIPLADLDRAPELLRIPESRAPVLRLPLLGGFVYAPTAAIIYQFCQVALHARATRVSHFEQPVFAWR
jgi:8-oxo-dGTP pyrophosphatase MutT (NUDIX family)